MGSLRVRQLSSAILRRFELGTPPPIGRPKTIGAGSSTATAVADGDSTCSWPIRRHAGLHREDDESAVGCCSTVNGSDLCSRLPTEGVVVVLDCRELEFFEGTDNFPPPAESHPAARKVHERSASTEANFTKATEHLDRSRISRRKKWHSISSTHLQDTGGTQS